MIDTHAHIYLEEFEKDIDEVIARCEELAIEKIYMPNIDHTSIDDMLELEERYPNTCVSMMGLHPCSVKKGFEKELYLVEEWLGKRNFVGVGEIGTDLYWDKTFWNEQQEALNIQLDFAKQYEIPAILHCRDSIDETIEIVGNKQDEKLTGIFHCFSGSVAQAEKVIDMGFYIGIGGVSTFKNGGMDKVLPHLPLDKLVLETDSPYLSPVPHRGKRNEPAYVALVAKRIAELKSISEDEVKEATTRNAKSIFKFTG
jgi:TatD DNase family protein